MRRIKDAVGSDGAKKFKTVECQIMDIADDIAYSTYDLEDSLKAEFQNPLLMISMSDAFKGRIVDRVTNNIAESYGDKSPSERKFDIADLNGILASVFVDLLVPSPETVERVNAGINYNEAAYVFGSAVQDRSRELARNGYIRTAFTSHLVGQFVRSVEFRPNKTWPSQSRVRLSLETFKVVETLKHYSFEHLIESPRLKLAERRGAEIIAKVFHTLEEQPSLLPEDWRNLYDAFKEKRDRRRVICDYIAGMSDQYCVEFHARITGTNPPSIWKPH